MEAFVELIKTAKLPDDRLALLKTLNKTLNDPTFDRTWDCTETVGILASWIEEHVNIPTNKDSAEIVNLVLVCFGKLPITGKMLSQTNVFLLLL